MFRIDKSNQNSRFLVSTDIDWAPDFVLEYVLKFFDELNVQITWFVTHKSPILEKINNSGHELGLHPNFNNLLNGKEYNKNSFDIIHELQKVVPKAVSIRSHSATWSSQIHNQFNQLGLKNDCNIFYPFSSGIIKPYKSFNSLRLIPYCWSDDIHIAYGWDYKKTLNTLIGIDELFCIDCHPIHIYLNSNNLKPYNTVKYDLNNQKVVDKHVNNSDYGTRNFLEELIESKK